jgi:hypothetical protein
MVKIEDLNSALFIKKFQEITTKSLLILLVPHPAHTPKAGHVRSCGLRQATRATRFLHPSQVSQLDGNLPRARLPDLCVCD